MCTQIIYKKNLVKKRSKLTNDDKTERKVCEIHHVLEGYDDEHWIFDMHQRLWPRQHTTMQLNSLLRGVWRKSFQVP